MGKPWHGLLQKQAQRALTLVLCPTSEPNSRLGPRLLEERQEMRSKQKVKEHPVTEELLQSLQFLPTQSLFPRLRAIVTVARAEQMALRAFAYENFLAVVKDHMATPGS